MKIKAVEVQTHVVIRLEVTNNTKLGAGGTINAKAPMIDCIYVDTDANLTWKPHTENIAA